jgi:hypothetical protein
VSPSLNLDAPNVVPDTNLDDYRATIVATQIEPPPPYHDPVLIGVARRPRLRDAAHTAIRLELEAHETAPIEAARPPRNASACALAGLGMGRGESTNAENRLPFQRSSNRRTGAAPKVAPTARTWHTHG